MEGLFSSFLRRFRNFGTSSFGKWTFTSTMSLGVSCNCSGLVLSDSILIKIILGAKISCTVCYLGRSVLKFS